MISSIDIKSRMAGVIPSRGVEMLTKSVGRDPRGFSDTAAKSRMPLLASNDRTLYGQVGFRQKASSGRLTVRSCVFFGPCAPSRLGKGG